MYILTNVKIKNILNKSKIHTLPASQ